jgi:nitrogenase molybdenum-iron protein alpha/beta subunit
MMLTYYVSGSLTDALTVANEIYSETGMLPEKIVTDKKEEVRFEKKEYHQLRKGKINEETYINNNLIM